MEGGELLWKAENCYGKQVTTHFAADHSGAGRHPHNAYIALLEDLRLQLRDTPFTFYQMLLSTPLPERALVLRQSGIMLEEQERQAFRMALLKAVFALSR